MWTLWVEKSLLLLPRFTSVSQLSTLHSSHYSYDTISAARCQWIINCVANRNNVCFRIAKKLYFHYYQQRFNAACTHSVFWSYVPLLKKVGFPYIGLLSMQVWVWSANHAPSWNFPIGWCWWLHTNDWECWLINPYRMYTSLSLGHGTFFNAFSKAVWPSILRAGTCTLYPSDSVFSLEVFLTGEESRVIR